MMKITEGIWNAVYRDGSTAGVSPAMQSSATLLADCSRPSGRFRGLILIRGGMAAVLPPCSSGEEVMAAITSMKFVPIRNAIRALRG